MKFIYSGFRLSFVVLFGVCAVSAPRALGQEEPIGPKWIEVTKMILRKAKTELDAAKASKDKAEIENAEKCVVTYTNIIHVQELARSKNVLECIASQDALGQAIRLGREDEFKQILKEGSLKFFLSKLAGLASANSGIIISLLWADTTARDPQEVFKDNKADEAEVRAAIRVTLSIVRDNNNKESLDQLYVLMFKKIGCEPK